MRDILFRAKKVTNDEWIEGYPFPLYHNQKCRHKSPHWLFIPKDADISKYRTIGSIQVEVQADTIGQFTGYKDKNGKAIYEGDIITFVKGQRQVNDIWVDDKETYIVEYEYGAFSGLVGCTQSLTAVEVIGNIYDNPELLKR